MSFRKNSRAEKERSEPKDLHLIKEMKQNEMAEYNGGTQGGSGGIGGAAAWSGSGGNGGSGGVGGHAGLFGG